MITKERIKMMAHEVGFDACGVTLPISKREAEERFQNWIREGKHGGMKYLEEYELRKQNFWARFPDVKSIIVLGVNYYSKELNPPPFAGEDRGGGNLKEASSTLPSYPSSIKGERDVFTGRVARYAWGKDYYRVIRGKLEILQRKIREEAGPDYKTQFESSVDTKPFLERTLAEQAGLGFIGKQTQLLSLQFGPWLFLSELITNLNLEPDRPFFGSCGTCRLCIDTCPTEAIEESGTVDARKCIAYLTIEHKTEIPIELRPRIGNWVFGCDECIRVCPYTAKQKESNWADLKADAGFGSELDLLKLLEIKSNREYEKLFGNTAISRASRKQLFRNACVVLGNTGSETALLLLQKVLEDSSPLVREHTAWAIKRIRDRALVAVKGTVFA